MNKSRPNIIADVQGRSDERRIPITRVGICDLRYPIRFDDGSQQRDVSATFNLSVGLPADRKGTHMSRFVELLEQFPAFSVSSIDEFCTAMLERLNAKAGTVELEFAWFMRKVAPVTQKPSWLDCQVSLLCDADDDVETHLSVAIPVTSLCPCSKEISAYGAHNQRSIVTLTSTTDRGATIGDLFAIAERSASSTLYPLLKREDEKYVTEEAYDNPKFVEDISRDAAFLMGQSEVVGAWQVVVENHESIHNHSAWATLSGDNRQ